jgi:hypothetical protein
MHIFVKRINFGDLSGRKNEFWGPFPSKNCKIGDGIGNRMTRWANMDDQIDIRGWPNWRLVEWWPDWWLIDDQRGAFGWQDWIYGGDQIGPDLKCDQMGLEKWLEKVTNLVTYDQIGWWPNWVTGLGRVYGWPDWVTKLELWPDGVTRLGPIWPLCRQSGHGSSPVYFILTEKTIALHVDVS